MVRSLRSHITPHVLFAPFLRLSFPLIHRLYTKHIVCTAPCVWILFIITITTGAVYEA
jgi:hypothetical protein